VLCRTLRTERQGVAPPTLTLRKANASMQRSGRLTFGRPRAPAPGPRSAPGPRRRRRPATGWAPRSAPGRGRAPRPVTGCWVRLDPRHGDRERRRLRRRQRRAPGCSAALVQPALTYSLAPNSVRRPPPPHRSMGHRWASISLGRSGSSRLTHLPGWSKTPSRRSRPSDLDRKRTSVLKHCLKPFVASSATAKSRHITRHLTSVNLAVTHLYTTPVFGNAVPVLGVKLKRG